MTILNLEYNDDNKGYTDGSIEVKLKEELEAGKSPEEILKEDDSWEALYHLSKERENILSWFPFKKDSRILEVGSGCGALTEALAKNAKEVVSVELTKNRAEVNFARNMELDNVEIIVGNFNDIKFEQKFDYIILNGVLEYAGSFTETEKPYEDFLKKLGELLTDDGMILTAIENRMGLKYLNGAPEDHTGLLFSGINNYIDIDFVKTFSKKELIELFEEAGFDHFKFYYPYPDYKLPNLIMDDDSLSLINAESADKNYNSKRLRFYDSIVMTTTLLKEEILDAFMNSFLLIASKKPFEIGTEYVKFPQSRQRGFSLVTSIVEEDGKKKVIKEAHYPEAKKHIDNIYQNYLDFKNDNFTLVPTERRDDKLIFDFIDCDTYEEYLIDLLEKGEFEEFEKVLLNFKHALLDGSTEGEDYYTDKFKEVFGEEEINVPMHLKDKSNLDLIFSNIMHDKEKHVIDYEWIMDLKLPQEFVLFRSLYYLYYQNHRVRDVISFDKLFDIVNSDGEIITQEMIPVFIEWDNHFGNKYVSSGQELQAKETFDVAKDLNELYESLDNISSLYVDLGKGFEEVNRIKNQLEIKEDKFKVTFDLSHFKDRRIELLRWDPVERSIKLKDLEFKTDKGIVKYRTDRPFCSDSVLLDDELLFIDQDPYFILEGNFDGVDSITITGEIKETHKDDLFQVLNKQNWKIRDKDEEIEDLTRQINFEKLIRLELEDLVHNLGGDYAT